MDSAPFMAGRENQFLAKLCPVRILINNIWVCFIRFRYKAGMVVKCNHLASLVMNWKQTLSHSINEHLGTEQHQHEPRQQVNISDQPNWGPAIHRYCRLIIDTNVCYVQPREMLHINLAKVARFHSCSWSYIFACYHTTHALRLHSILFTCYISRDTSLLRLFTHDWQARCETRHTQTKARSLRHSVI